MPPYYDNYENSTNEDTTRVELLLEEIEFYRTYLQELGVKIRALGEEYEQFPALICKTITKLFKVVRAKTREKDKTIAQLKKRLKKRLGRKISYVLVKKKSKSKRLYSVRKNAEKKSLDDEK